MLVAASTGLAFRAEVVAAGVLKAPAVQWADFFFEMKSEQCKIWWKLKIRVESFAVKEGLWDVVGQEGAGWGRTEEQEGQGVRQRQLTVDCILTGTLCIKTRVLCIETRVREIVTFPQFKVYCAKTCFWWTI